MTETDLLINFLHYHPESSRAEIEDGAGIGKSPATIKRIIGTAIGNGLVVSSGQGRATRYSITPKAHLLASFDIDTYFLKEVDERTVQKSFNLNLIDKLLPSVDIFSQEEMERLDTAQKVFAEHIASMTKVEYDKEMERLGIDLSWKSSQIEGNTYSLLETERLLKEKQEAEGKSREEAIMLLNHKDTLKFIIEETDYLKELSISHIDDIHTLLTKDLNVPKGIRTRRVGITGTNYLPLDNQFQLREALQSTCNLINGKDNIFEKALLSLVLISYIQPFTDGNKRTARLICNAILMANGYCPISFRSVSSIDYKKAMLVFYEQNNIYPFKQIFIEQFEFATRTYF